MPLVDSCPYCSRPFLVLAWDGLWVEVKGLPSLVDEKHAVVFKHSGMASGFNRTYIRIYHLLLEDFFSKL